MTLAVVLASFRTRFSFAMVTKHRNVRANSGEYIEGGRNARQRLSSTSMGVMTPATHSR